MVILLKKCSHFQREEVVYLLLNTDLSFCSHCSSTISEHCTHFDCIPFATILCSPTFSSYSSFFFFFARLWLRQLKCIQSTTQKIVIIIFNVVKVRRNRKPTHCFSVLNTMQNLLRGNMSLLKSLTRKVKHCRTFDECSETQK